MVHGSQFIEMGVPTAIGKKITAKKTINNTTLKTIVGSRRCIIKIQAEDRELDGYDSSENSDEDSSNNDDGDARKPKNQQRAPTSTTIGSTSRLHIFLTR
ncbi:hypothetical protein ACH5RR_006692 [Cinchona calisaya]|uniref:Uncharacterized protein n=1 Tax=Cinchona calisaya TaxID=153742 RepID=A0ABD3APS7_9GENT